MIKIGILRAHAALKPVCPASVLVEHYFNKSGFPHTGVDPELIRISACPEDTDDIMSTALDAM